VETAVNLFIIELIVIAAALLYINADAYSAVTALIPIYIASMFRSVKRLTFTAIVTVGSVIALSQLIPGNWVELFGVLTLLIVTTTMIIVRSSLQWRAESELRQRNEQLTESEARFRAAIDAGLSIFLLLRMERDSTKRAHDLIIVDANLRTVELFQTTHDNLIGRSVLQLLPEAYRQYFLPLLHQVGDKGVPIVNETVLIQDTWLEYQIVPVGDGIAVSVQDITERMLATAKLETSLHEKEILLKEVHHRVKNNLQIISSLLNLQSNAIDNPLIRTQFQDSQNRIRSMALIHERLYRSDDLASIDFDSYLRDLAGSLVQTYQPQAQRVELRMSTARVLLNIDTAIACGLILNELVSNALKHAFPDSRPGQIGVELLEDRELHQFRLVVWDNGVGIPGNMNYQQTTSLGLQLVNSLTRQLNGTVDLCRVNGTRFDICFPGVSTDSQ
jgi:two-component sensor histidine kinase/PAS domain-containing protein